MTMCDDSPGFPRVQPASRRGCLWPGQRAGPPRSGSGGRREARPALGQQAFCACGSVGQAAERVVDEAQCGFGGSVPGPGVGEQGTLPCGSWGFLCCVSTAAY